MVSLWFDRLTTIGFFPNVLSEVEGEAQYERLTAHLIFRCMTDFCEESP